MAGLEKNVASQKWRVFAFNKTNGNALTGDAANITAKIAKDWAAAVATNDVNPTETEDGYYNFDLTQAETDAKVLDLFPESSTADIQVVGVPGTIYTVPSGFATTAMRGTDNAFLASVGGALADAAAAGDPTSADTMMQYVKQLVNTLEGTVGIPTYPAAADPANNVSLAEAIRAIRDDVTGIAGAAMRGTDSAALASVCSEARLSELDAGTGGKMAAEVDIIKDAVFVQSGTADSGSTTTMVDAALTEADDYWNGAWIRFTSGSIAGQTRLITDFDAATDTITFAPATTAAVSTNAYQILTGVDTIATLVGHTPQTGDSFARLGAPAGASVSADIATIEAQTDDIGVAGAGLTGIPWNAAWDAEVQSEVNDALIAQGLDHLVNVAVVGADITDNSIIAKLVSKSATADWDDFVNTDDSLQAIRDRGDAAWITGAGGGLTPLASGTAQGGTASTIQLAAGETFADDELNNNVVKITSGTGAGQSRLITDYTGATDTATVAPNWTTNPDATSVYEVVDGPMGALQPTTIGNTLDVTATGAAGIDWGNIENPSTTVDLSATDINLCDTVTTLTGHTPQTGDSFARLGAPAGASVSADIAAVQADTDNIQTRLPAALIGGRMDVTVGAMQTDVVDNVALAANAVDEIVDAHWDELRSGHVIQGSFGESFDGIEFGNAVTGTLSTTNMTTDLIEATDDHYIGRTIVWTTGALKRQASDITDYIGATKELVFTAVTEAPANGDNFILV